MSVNGLCGVFIPAWVGAGKLQSQWEVVCLYGHTTSYWPCHFTAPTQPGINTPHNPSTDILHSRAYEDGTDSEFRNVGN